MLSDEFNKPLPLLRPIEHIDVPVMEDHIGYCPPHEMNIPKNNAIEKFAKQFSKTKKPSV